MIRVPRRNFLPTGPLVGLVAGLVLVAALAACAPSDPYAALDARRSQYTAQAQGFYVDEQVVEMPEVAEMAEGEEGDAGETADAPAEAEAAADAAEGADAEAETMEPPDVDRDIVVDILVQNEADQALTLLTIDVEHVDASETLKERRLVTLDVSGVGRGNVGQFTERLEDMDFVEGDKITAAVRAPVPPEERADYPEFAELEGGG